jgi:hypothetical protein
MSKAESTAFVAAIMLAVGVIGFVVSLGWGKASGRDMDRDTVLFLIKMWGGIVLVGLILNFVM